MRSRVFGLVALLVLGSWTLSAESYGTGEQVLHIGAAAMLPYRSTEAFGFSAGYLYDDGASPDPTYFVAPLTLPAGAEITRLCLYAYDANPSLNAFLSVSIVAVKLTPGGATHDVVYIPNTTVATTFDIGYGVVCTDPFSYVYRDTGDVDGDGFEEHVAHQLELDFNPGSELMFGGVRIFWRRQMSAPPATATFADVPTTHPFFRSIEALAASGITSGCGPGHFCPNQNVTRGEMAAFLSRALGLYWPF